MRAIARMLITAIFASSLFIALPQKTAHAQIDFVSTAAIAPLTVPVTDVPNAVKEGFWDAVAFGIAKMFINRLTINLVEWIRKGYDGQPTFLTNPEAFFRDVGNQATGVFINEMGLNEVMCEPWRFGAVLGLTFQKPYLIKAKCTLLDAQTNFQKMSTNFMAAGWKGFFDITVKQENNPYGAFLQARSELAIRVGKAEEKQKEDLFRGRGFFSITKKGACVSHDIDGLCEKYAPDTTVTPGSYIADSVSVLGMSSVRQAELADELNESLNIIAGEMIMQAINPNRGLASFDTVPLENAEAAFQKASGGRLKDVAAQKISDISAARDTEANSLTMIRGNIYPIYKDLIGIDLIASPDSLYSGVTVDDVSVGSSCLGNHLRSASDDTAIATIRGEIANHIATLAGINQTELTLAATIAQAEPLLTTLNGWYSELTAATSPSPARFDQITSGLNGVSFPASSAATAEYNDLVSKRDSAQSALTSCLQPSSI